MLTRRRKKKWSPHVKMDLPFRFLLSHNWGYIWYTSPQSNWKEGALDLNALNTVQLSEWSTEQYNYSTLLIWKMRGKYCAITDTFLNSWSGGFTSQRQWNIYVRETCKVCLRSRQLWKKGSHYMFQLCPKFIRLTSFINERSTNQHTEDDILKMAKCRGRVVPSQLTKKIDKFVITDW